LEEVVQKFKNLKLVVMDTFAEHLRGSENNYSERRRMVSMILMNFQRIAAKYGIAFVLVNNMKTGKREFI
jgi:RecA/RadA recombinase